MSVICRLLFLLRPKWNESLQQEFKDFAVSTSQEKDTIRIQPPTNLKETDRVIRGVLVHGCKEDDGHRVLVPHHPPEVGHGRLQRVLRHDVLVALVVTLP